MKVTVVYQIGNNEAGVETVSVDENAEKDEIVEQVKKQLLKNGAVDVPMYPQSYKILHVEHEEDKDEIQD
jgi:hypothetical protein